MKKINESFSIDPISAMKQLVKFGINVSKILACATPTRSNYSEKEPNCNFVKFTGNGKVRVAVFHEDISRPRGASKSTFGGMILSGQKQIDEFLARYGITEVEVTYQANI